MDPRLIFFLFSLCLCCFGSVLIPGGTIYSCNLRAVKLLSVFANQKINLLELLDIYVSFHLTSPILVGLLWSAFIPRDWQIQAWQRVKSPSRRPHRTTASSVATRFYATYEKDRNAVCISASRRKMNPEYYKHFIHSWISLLHYSKPRRKNPTFQRNMITSIRRSIQFMIAWKFENGHSRYAEMSCESMPSKASSSRLKSLLNSSNSLSMSSAAST
jgi:hypothetical protein